MVSVVCTVQRKNVFSVSCGNLTVSCGGEVASYTGGHSDAMMHQALRSKHTTACGGGGGLTYLQADVYS